MKVDILFLVPNEDSIPKSVKMEIIMSMIMISLPRSKSLVLKIKIICLLTKAKTSAISLKYLITFALISAL